jgi:hypothetical protein
VAGQSQGGGAALWAAQLAHTYAAELDARGAVALAPAAELPTILAAVAGPPLDAQARSVANSIGSSPLRCAPELRGTRVA